MTELKPGGLTEAIIVFNLLPATYADPTWIDAPAPWRARLQHLQSPSARAALSEWLLQRLGVANCHDFDFGDVEKAMFLLGPQELQALAAKVGLLRYRDALRCRIGGGLFARLASEVGAETVQQGLAGLPPAASLPPPDAEFDIDQKHLLPQLVAAGAPWLLGFLRPAWHAVAMRARLKFSRELAAQPPVPLEGVERDAALAYLKMHLLKKESV